MTDFNFTAYPKMADNTDLWLLDGGEWRQLSNLQWVVTEKIHGANFCFVVTADDVLCAKRKAILEADDDFFGYLRVKARLKEKVHQLFARLKEEKESLTQLLIYGELFGGSYPHDDVPAIAELEAVQTGIYYSPELEFSVFDMAWDADWQSTSTANKLSTSAANQHLTSGGKVEFLDFEKTLELCKQSELFSAKPLLKGTFRECLAFELGFDSTIPEQLGLPPLIIPNLAEGVVIRPLTNVTVRTNKGPRRPLLKRKIPKFSEDARYKGSQKRERKNYVAPMDIIEWRMLELLTEQRLDNVLSKIGKLTDENLPEVNRALVDDIWEELALSETSALNGLTHEERKLLESVLEDETHMLVSARKKGR